MLAISAFLLGGSHGATVSNLSDRHGRARSRSAAWASRSSASSGRTTDGRTCHLHRARSRIRSANLPKRHRRSELSAIIVIYLLTNLAYLYVNPIDDGRGVADWWPPTRCSALFRSRRRRARVDVRHDLVVQFPERQHARQPRACSSRWPMTGCSSRSIAQRPSPLQDAVCCDRPGGRARNGTCHEPQLRVADRTPSCSRSGRSTRLASPRSTGCAGCVPTCRGRIARIGYPIVPGDFRRCR